MAPAMSASISPERWKAIQPLIDRALDTAPAERSAFYERVCGGDAITRGELERLVGECERPDIALDMPLPERFPTLFEHESSLVLPGLDERFRIDRVLGGGGMATVYLARDLRHEREVAIKVLHPDLAAVLGADRFLTEIRVTARLHDRHILPLFDSGQADGTLYYVMPYVGGETLRARLDRELQLPLVDALGIARDVVAALDCAHRQGVIHRDIKPENILLADGQAFVLDFGISRAVSTAGGERITQPGIALGTPQYMSPEQASGRRDVDVRTDVYALGAVLYEMLAGEAPFTGPTAQAVIAKMMSSEPPSVRRMRPTIPESLDRVIRKALAPVPADRFASAGELARALSMDDTSAESPSVATRPRRRWPFLAGALVLAIVATFAISRLRNQDPPLVDRRVLVVPFENRTGLRAHEALGAAAAADLTRQLTAARLAEPVNLRESGDVARDADGRALGVLARRIGASRILRGSYYKQGDSLRFEPQLLDSWNGDLAETIPPVVVPADAPSAALESLSQHVLAVFAVLTDRTFDAWRVASHPATYDAYLEYAAARRTGTATDRVAADYHLARATRLDSTFTLPLVWLMWDRGCEVTDSVVNRLGPRLDRLPVFDRGVISMYHASCHGLRDVEYHAAREVYDSAPASGRAAVLFAFTARHNNHISEAVAAMEKLDSVQYGTSQMYWGNRLIPYHLLGKYELELSTANQALRYFPDNWEFMAMKGRALAALGRVDELRPLLDSMKSIPLNAAQVGTPTGWMGYIARELRVHGHPNEARAVSDTVLAWFRARPPPTDPEVREELARALYDAGRWEQAGKEVRQLLRADPTNIGLRSLAGAVAARLGDRRTVDRTDAWLASLKRPYLNGDNTFERARLAAILGERVRANDLFLQALDDGFAIFQRVGPHEDPDFDSIREMSAYKLLYRDKD
jgi:serine/threonine protein kinase/tetratricopeptide (TPR) repeat protein